jgi:epoxyqueuosine reductase
MNGRDKNTDEWKGNSSSIIDNLFKSLNLQGYKATIVPIMRLKELKEDIYERNRRGQFAPELFNENFNAFDFNKTTEKMPARSIVIIAVQQPHVRLGITLGKRPLSVIIPPTYSTRIDSSVEQILKQVLEPAGHSFFKCILPLKLLAVRSGLARYGRNNLAYVEGMGSYCRLLAFFTSLAIDDSIWIDPRPLEECEKCVACMKKCPTNAISRDRFLIRAERCLTFHNERKVAFPDDILPEWHHCLIGCLYCQAYCPVNRKGNGWVEDCGTLNESDTTILLNGGPPQALSKSATSIIDQFEFSEDLAELSRNLKVLLNQPGNISRVAKLLQKDSTREGNQIR